MSTLIFLNTSKKSIIQKQHTKIAEIKYDVSYLLHCKRNGLIPNFSHFAKQKLAVEINKYLRNKIGHQILDAEVRNKHRKKERLLQQVKNNTDSLTNKVGLIAKIAFYRKSKLIIKKKKQNKLINIKRKWIDFNEKNDNLINQNFAS